MQVRPSVSLRWILIYALVLNGMNAVKNCAQCVGMTCILETNDPIPIGENFINMHFCNFDKTKSNDYKLSFSLKLPLACDPENDKVVPVTSALEAQGPCPPDNCLVRVHLEKPLDWAVAAKVGADTNILQAKLVAHGGLPVQDAVVGVASSTAAIGSTSSDSNTDAIIIGQDTETTEGKEVSSLTMCSTTFYVAGSRFSRVAECNVVELCLSDDTKCPTPLSSSQLIDHVHCEQEKCTGVISLSDPLLCGESSEKKLLANLKVANSTPSSFVSIGTLDPIPPLSITGINGASEGSKQLELKTNSICPIKSLQVNVTGYNTTNLTSANGLLTVMMNSPLDSITARNVQVTVSQCNIVSKPYSANSIPTFEKPSSGISSQQSNTRAGLPGGVYIGSVIGFIACVGFIVECVHHKRKQAQPAVELSHDFEHAV